jgi:hypothetical protein
MATRINCGESETAAPTTFRLKSKKTKRLAVSNISIRQALNCWLGLKN